MSAFDTLTADLQTQQSKKVLVDRLDLEELLAEVSKRRATSAKKSAKKATANQVATVIEGYPVWLPLDAWNAFLDMRKKIKKPATEYAQKLLLKKLTAFYANEFDPLQILNQSTLNGWQDLYAPKEIGTALRGQFVDRPSVQEQNRANTVKAKQMLFGRRSDVDGPPFLEDDHA